MNGDSSDDDRGYGRGARSRRKQTVKSRRELPAGAVATLRAWMLSPEHFTHPYPTPQDQVVLMEKTGIDKKQLKNWFTNARRRIWKPLLEKQREEQGIDPSTGNAPPGGGGQVAPLPIASAEGKPAAPIIYQQALGPQQQGYGNSGAPSYSQQTPSSEQAGSYYPPPDPMIVQSNSIGSLPGVSSSGSSENVAQMSKTDSQAMLMELFRRDQDLVRQATEGARLKAQAAAASSDAGGGGGGAPNPVSSWPHFSSISSLNNLGTMTGVKSITNMSGTDLAGKGSNPNLKGNLSKVKSIESMGCRTDSYALFMGVFFDDCIDPAAAAGSPQGLEVQKGLKRDRDEDNDVGLSLDAEAPFKRKPTSVAFGA